MRRSSAGACSCSPWGLVFVLAFVVLSVAPAPAGAVAYWAETAVPVDEPQAFTLEQSLRVDLDPPVESLGRRLGGELVLRQATRGADEPARWGGSLRLAAGSLQGWVLYDDDHRSSTEPFRLVHRSSRSPDAWAGGLEWHGAWSGQLQYVQAVPLRGRPGPLLMGQVQGPAPWPRLAWVGYGTDQLQHQFFVLDGSWRLSPGVDVTWGGAWQRGLEVAAAPAVPGGLVPVSEAAGFVRLNVTSGRHRWWVLVHGTSPGFRSLVASTYPFYRGRAGWEGRWQFRPRPNHLLSVYGQLLWPLGDGYRDARELEFRYSVAPRQQWAWHAGAALSLNDDGPPAVTWQAGVRDPDRRLDVSLELGTGGPELRWRPRLEWRADGWRVVLGADSAFPGWRLQWTHTGHPLWDLTVVYKERWDQAAHPPVRGWSYVRLARRFSDSGEVWVRWGDWDQGRLDVGWSRPRVLALGIARTF